MGWYFIVLLVSDPFGSKVGPSSALTGHSIVKRNRRCSLKADIQTEGQTHVQRDRGIKRMTDG
jgi:hypothetical protein